MTYIRKTYDLPSAAHIREEAAPESLDFWGMLMAMRAEQTWRDQAVCRGMDPDIFHPGRGENEKLEEAKRVCATCPVTEECLEFAMAAERADSRVGIYGGLGGQRRKDLSAARSKGLA